MSKDIVISNKLLKKESRSLALQDNLSLIPITLGLAGSGITFALDFIMILYVCLGVVGLGVTIMFTNLAFRQSHYQQHFLKDHNLHLKEENLNKLKNIKKTLKSEKASGQLHRFEVKYLHFKDVISGQLSESSLAYQRLVGGFDQLYLMATNSIEKVLSYEKNIGAIDVEFSEKQLKILEDKAVLQEYEKSEMQSIRERLNILNDYKHKINEIISNNEVALTKMDTTQASLTGLQKPENMRSALQELQTLANVLDRRSNPKTIELT